MDGCILWHLKSYRLFLWWHVDAVDSFVMLSLICILLGLLLFRCTFMFRFVKLYIKSVISVSLSAQKCNWNPLFLFFNAPSINPCCEFGVGLSVCLSNGKRVCLKIIFAILFGDTFTFKAVALKCHFCTTSKNGIEKLMIANYHWKTDRHASALSNFFSHEAWVHIIFHAKSIINFFRVKRFNVEKCTECTFN